MTETDDKVVKELLNKAVKQHDSGDAMRFAQAACNAANAIAVLTNLQRCKD